jgi:hypothetical protein
LFLELVTLFSVHPPHSVRLSRTSSPVPSQSQSLTMNPVQILARDDLESKSLPFTSCSGRCPKSYPSPAFPPSVVKGLEPSVQERTKPLIDLPPEFPSFQKLVITLSSPISFATIDASSQSLFRKCVGKVTLVPVTRSDTSQFSLHRLSRI